mmetsp:Transcript_58407/g.138952  ORF Transcript_58407/g.138952 Transcript_58407/m.138952 type:complete len:221 (+) Transcript_58407:372-1034(+)
MVSFAVGVVHGLGPKHRLGPPLVHESAGAGFCHFCLAAQRVPGHHEERRAEENDLEREVPEALHPRGGEGGVLGLDLHGHQLLARGLLEVLRRLDPRVHLQLLGEARRSHRGRVSHRKHCSSVGKCRRRTRAAEHEHRGQRGNSGPQYELRALRSIFALKGFFAEKVMRVEHRHGERARGHARKRRRAGGQRTSVAGRGEVHGGDCRREAQRQWEQHEDH